MSQHLPKVPFREIFFGITPGNNHSARFPAPGDKRLHGHFGHGPVSVVSEATVNINSLVINHVL